MIARSTEQGGHRSSSTSAIGDDTLLVPRDHPVEVAEVAYGGLEVE